MRPQCGADDKAARLRQPFLEAFTSRTHHPVCGANAARFSSQSHSSLGTRERPGGAFDLAGLGGLLAFWVSRKIFRTQGMSLNVIFLFLFGAGLVFVALEEISWGQTFFHYPTPVYFAEHNVQQEVTIHNLEGLHGNSDYLYLVFGIFGLCGAYGFRSARWKSIAVPVFLLSLLWTITICSLISVIQGIWDLGLVQYGFGRKL